MIGELLGNYRVVSKIGQGGMGAVYLAEHQRLGRPAAVKVLLPGLSADPENIRRFFNEARAATLLRHPAFVDVFDFGEHTSGQAYLIMDYLEGETVAGRLRRCGRLPIGTAVELGRQVAAAIAVAHQAGIVHRDLKPENLFLVRDPEVANRERIKILDFGIAKLGAGFGTGPRGGTRPGVVLGTPIFMAPEQCRGSHEVDARTDIYALACILFYMLTGRPPFVRDSAADMLLAHVSERPPSPASLEPTVTAALDRLVLRGLAKAPADRPQSMTELERELRAINAALPSDSTQLLEAAAPAPVYPTSASAPVGGRATRVLDDRAERSRRGFEPGNDTTLGASASETSSDGFTLRLRLIAGGLVALAVFGVAGFLYARRRADPPAEVVAAPIVPTAPVAAERAPRPSVFEPPAREPVPPEPAQDPAAEALAPTVIAVEERPRAAVRAGGKGEAGRSARVAITIVNPPAGLTVTSDGTRIRLPIVLPRDGAAHLLRFEAKGFEPEVQEVTADRDRRVKLKNQRLLFIE